MSGNLLKIYDQRVASGELEANDRQRLAAMRFDELQGALSNWQKSRGAVGWLLGRARERPYGIYIHGSVGRGKTMLMDMFYEAVGFKRKRRVHFHEFMAEVHDKIGEARKHVDGDPIPYVAKQMANEAKLLCFDELHITDIADAMIVGRLFTGLFEDDVIVVATSNARPDELYKNGLNRQLFLPFIGLLTQHMDVVELDAAKDFRLEKLSGKKLYFSPLDEAAEAGLNAIWDELVGGASVEESTLEVKGRKVRVPQSAMGVARFTFADLCGQPLGASDYLAIARAFHTIIIEAIPVLTPARRNEARRFINLIDTLYDSRISLIASAEAEPNKIYPEGDGSDLFQRTESRLFEMRSEEYLAARAERLREAESNDSDSVEASGTV